MNLPEKLERSKSTERIDFSKYQSAGANDPLIKITPPHKLLVEPIWTLPDDFEGKMYADYIAKHPEYDGIYLRSEVLARLVAAAEALPEPCQLVIRAGHRPVEIQKRLLRECAADFKRDNPSTSDEEALTHARLFVSDPDIKLPPHVCGAAVDVEIKDNSNGKLLDCGTVMNEDTEKSFLYYPNLTEQQKVNRSVLLSAMLDAGFASLMSEWWHFSYGDQVWAWFYGEENSLYNSIDL